MRKKGRARRAVRVFFVPFFCGCLLAGSSAGTGWAAEIKEVSESEAGTGTIQYHVSFVDAEDRNTWILNPQSGRGEEGTSIVVSYPNRVVGRDGCLWSSVEESPQTFTLYQAGEHKYYIEYQQGEKIASPWDPDEEGKARLEQWLEKAWKADCLLTGEDPEGSRSPYLIVSGEEENRVRVRNLVSMVQDGDWHYFYMIGKGYTPASQVIGTEFDAVYSSVKEDSFTVGEERYQVYRFGVRRNWDPETCVHVWEKMDSIAGGCLINGSEHWRCGRCQAEETTLLPALGHQDADGDALCDRCGKRAFSQELGSRITSMAVLTSGVQTVAWTCIDEDYLGHGKMLYLSEQVFTREELGISHDLEELFDESDYNVSSLRQWMNLEFSNLLSLSPAMRLMYRPDGDGVGDLGILLSREEYENYRAAGLLEVEELFFLRSREEGNVCVVGSSGEVELISLDALPENSASGNGEAPPGIRPAILLDRPETGEAADSVYWKEGDVQIRQIGSAAYRFHCVDEDYSDAMSGHRRAALFLCDRVIRSDIDSDSFTLQTFSFGETNNYKYANVRNWLQKNSENSSFNLEPIYIGVNTAYTGSTEEGAFAQLTEERLTGRDIGFQLMQDRLFCLSVEEALKYREKLWRFGEEKENPASQVSAYSQGYYLRTPFYETDSEGIYRDGARVYAVDLVKGNIHPVETNSETYGLRPAFALPQE